MDKRHSNDGQPFYCETCGRGFDEYISCEEPYCELESELAAALRRVRWLKGIEKREAEKPLSIKKDPI